tara:strand:- start:4182 stop:5840 length:1659 start_codon:yes stop_codon:yes gene_type:complete
MIEFILDGTVITSPLEWQEISFKASFEQTVQADISVSELTFGLDACNLIDSWRSNNGYFRGMPLVIQETGFTIFEGHLDFQEKFEIIHKGKYLVSIKKTQGLNYLSDKINAYTFGLLAENRNLTYHEVRYVVHKGEYGVEEALLQLTLLLALKEIVEAGYKLSVSIYRVATAVLSPFSLAKDLAQIVIQAILDLVTFAILFNLYFKHIKAIIIVLLPIVQKHKSINVLNVLQEFCLDIGFNGFETGITELKDMYYFPSKDDDKSKGIPKVGDYGYSMKEFIELIESSFNAKLYIDNNNKVQLRSENDTYLIKNSTYILPDVLVENVEYNTDEISGTYNISFNTDISDTWTVENFKGTALDVYTKSTLTKGVDLVKNLTSVNINACLGSRKSELTNLEKSLKAVATAMDKLSKALFKKSNLVSKVVGQLGMVKVSNTSWSKPKILKLDANLKLSSNRSSFSARYLWDNYHSYKSFVLNSNGYQRRVFKDIDIPFNLKDLKAVINNSYFTDLSGNLGKFVNIEYNADNNKAKASFWVQEVYDSNLKETYIEPGN